MGLLVEVLGGGPFEGVLVGLLFFLFKGVFGVLLSLVLGFEEGVAV